ncbi:uncharacterized protein LOC114254270 [Monomorium pharaonis]|uniref:uncharacterized protein LOC114254270 n=1 Tax=Monomorium pharaonis TaxID=307658 RepID=UPI001745F3F5|nr:uncharacterized protein LOC114254270 [Monomorium pharaonis]
MTVSIQNTSCPVFDLEQNIKFFGHWQTVNRRGNITVPMQWQETNYKKPNQKEFENAMSRVLKSLKERRRKYLINTGNLRCRRDDLSNDDDGDQLETHVQPIQ